MELALTILSILNAAAPVVSDLIVLIKRKDGSVSALTILDEADSAFEANIRQAKDWLTSHANKPEATKPRI